MKGYSLQGLPDTYAKVALGMSSGERGIGAMSTETQAFVGTQAANDPFTDPKFTGQQSLREMQQVQQAQGQSAMSAASQRQVGSDREMGRMMTDAASAENKAQRLASEYEVNILESMGGDMDLFKAASAIDPRMIAIGKLNSVGEGPGLGGIVARDNLMRQGII